MWLPIISFLLVVVGTPIVANFTKNQGITGRDLNKPGFPEIPEAGGIAIFIVLALSLIYMDYMLLSGVVLLMGIFSFLDDIYRYGTFYKVLFPLLISFIFYFEVGRAGLLFAVVYFVLITNLSNTLAGLNGLEVGLGAIISIFFASFLYLNSSAFTEPLLVLFAVCLGFLLHNWNPARVFPGNIGTYTIGAFLAGVGILSGYWYALLILFIPQLIDIALKFYSADIFQKIIRRSKENTLSEYKPLVCRNGKLYLPKKSYLSLIRVILKKPRTEQETVLIVLFAEVLVGVIMLWALVIV